MKLVATLQKSVLAVSVLALAGCSVFSDEEPTYKELQPYNQSVTPSVAWSGSIGDGVGGYFSRLNPTVVGDTLVAADREGLVRGYDRNSGKSLWSVDLQAKLAAEREGLFAGRESLRISGGLTTAGDDTVVLGTESGYVVMLNTSSGEIVWHTDVKSEVMADPAVDFGVVVVSAGNGKIIGLDQASGEQLWSLSTDVPALSLRGTGAPTLANGGALVGTANGKLTVIVVENGQQAWEARLAVPSGATELQRLVDVDSKPIVRGGNIYNIAYNGKIAAVETRSGRVLWQREYSSFQNLDIFANSLFLTDVNDHVYALDANGGVEKWVNTDLEGRELTAPVYFNGSVVVGDEFGYLHFIDVITGEMEGRLDIGDALYVAPVATEDTLYIQTRDGSLLAVRI